MKQSLQSITDQVKAVKDNLVGAVAVGMSTTPGCLMCPVRRELMLDPVVLETGHSFSRQVRASPHTLLGLPVRALPAKHALSGASSAVLAKR